MSNDEPLQPLPFGHEKVQWRGTRVGRCGMRGDGKVAPGFCGKKFRFRGCVIAGKSVVANCCNQCTLKYDIAHATTPGLKMAWAVELAELIGCDIEYAITISQQAFPKYSGGHSKPTDSPDDPEIYE